MTPAEVREAVERYGGQNAAARALGIPRTTLQNWLDPEKERARQRRRYDRDPEWFRAKARKHFHDLTGVEYNRRLLQMRRAHAMRRKRQREQRRTEEAI